MARPKIDHEHLPAVYVDPAALGPAMLELTEKQQKFVVALLEIGGENESRAAAMAGYGIGFETRSYELVRNPKILAAIREEADKRLRSGALMASSKLNEIARNNQHKDQLKAVIELLNRGGLQVMTTHKVIVEDTRNDAEIIARVAAFAKELDIDPAKLLAKVGVDYIEGQFTEVSPKVLLSNPLRAQDIKPSGKTADLQPLAPENLTDQDDPFADMMGPPQVDDAALLQVFEEDDDDDA